MRSHIVAVLLGNAKFWLRKYSAKPYHAHKDTLIVVIINNENLS